MTGVNRVDIIQLCINQIKAKIYVEIGVANGGTFLSVQAKNKIAVDPVFSVSFIRKLFHPTNFWRSLYFTMTSDNFFEKHAEVVLKQGIDVAFIDGMHTYENSLRDVQNCLKYLNEGGIIMMHDCNPPTRTSAIVPAELASKEKDWAYQWCGNAWKTIVNLRSVRDDLKVFVVDEDYGVGIITKGKPGEMLNYSVQDIDNMDYEILDNNRDEILNLKTMSYLTDW